MWEWQFGKFVVDPVISQRRVRALSRFSYNLVFATSYAGIVTLSTLNSFIFQRFCSWDTIRAVNWETLDGRLFLALRNSEEKSPGQCWLCMKCFFSSSKWVRISEFVTIDISADRFFHSLSQAGRSVQLSQFELMKEKKRTVSERTARSGKTRTMCIRMWSPMLSYTPKRVGAGDRGQKRTDIIRSADTTRYDEMVNAQTIDWTIAPCSRKLFEQESE